MNRDSATTTSSCDNNNNNTQQREDLVLVAAVSWEVQRESGSDASSFSQSTKLRVYKSDYHTDRTLSSDNTSGVVPLEGSVLQRLLRQKLETELVLKNKHHISGDDDDDSTTAYVVKMDVYDPLESSYVSLEHPDVQRVDVLQRFGTRLRVQVSVIITT